MAHGEVNHNRPIITYENIALFKSDKHAFFPSSNSGSGIDLVENVQSANFSFSIDNKRKGELGSKIHLDTNFVRAPEVQLEISKYENMDGLFTDFFSGGSVADLNKDQNFYMFFSDKKHQDIFPFRQSNDFERSERINNMLDISGKDVLAFGNAFLSNVSINQQVGGLLEGQYQYTCSNILAEKIRIENVDPDENIAYANLFDNMETDENLHTSNKFKTALQAPKGSLIADPAVNITLDATAGLLTLTTTTAHNLEVGQSVTLHGFPTVSDGGSDVALDGTFTIPAGGIDNDKEFNVTNTNFSSDFSIAGGANRFIDLTETFLHKATGFLGLIQRFGGQPRLVGDRDLSEPPFTNIDAGFTPSGKSLTIADVGNAYAISPTGFKDLAVYVISGTYRTTGVRELMVPSGFCFNLVHGTDETQSIRATGFSITGGGGAHSVTAINTSQLNSYTGHWVTTAITGFPGESGVGDNVRISFVKTGLAHPTGGSPCYIISGFNLTHGTSQIFGTGLEPNFFPHQTNYNFASPYEPGTGISMKNPFGPTGEMTGVTTVEQPNGGLTQIINPNHIMPFTGISGYGFNLGGSGTHRLPLPLEGATNVGPQPLTQVSGSELINHSGNLILVDSVPNIMFSISRTIINNTLLGAEPVFTGSSTGARDFLYTGIFSATDLPLLLRGTDFRITAKNEQITTGSVILKDLFIKKTGEYVVSNPAIQLTGNQEQQTISAKLGNMPTGKGTRFGQAGREAGALQSYLKSNKTTASGGFYPYFKTHVSITSADPDVREFLINSQNIQNFSIDIPIPRRNYYSLGKQYPVYKREIFPSDSSFSFSNLVSTFVTGEVGSDKVNLKSLLNENENYIISISGENYYDDRDSVAVGDVPFERPGDFNIEGTGLVYNNFNYVITGAKLNSLSFNNGGVDGGATTNDLDFTFNKENFIEAFSIPISGAIFDITNDTAFIYNMTNMQTGTGFSGVFDFASFNSLDFGAHLFGPTDAGFIRDTNLGTIKAFNGKKTIQMVVAANNNRQIDWDNSIVSGGQVKNVNSSPTEAEILAVPAFNVGNAFGPNIATDRLSIADIEINTNEFNPNDVIFFHLTTEST